MVKRSYNLVRADHSNQNEGYLPGLADKASIKWMKEQSAREGKEYAQWCTENGIMSEWAEKKAHREVPMSSLPDEMFLIDNRVSLQEWRDETPGGDKVASIIEDNDAKIKVKGPRRNRGRPRKYFVRVPNE